MSCGSLKTRVVGEGEMGRVVVCHNKHDGGLPPLLVQPSLSCCVWQMAVGVSLGRGGCGG